MRNDLIELIQAVDEIADTSFRVDEVVNPVTGHPTADPVVRNLVLQPRLAKRRSASDREGFYRPGERSKDGTPFEVLPTKCPPYGGPPSGRVPTAEEKRETWPLQNEYLANRLGRDNFENSRLWDTANWIYRLGRIVMTPKDAVRPALATTPPDEFTRDAGEIADFKIAEAVSARAFEIVRIREKIEEQEAISRIDVNKLLGSAGPRQRRIDLPDVYDRAEANKIIRMLRLGLRTLWLPLVRAIFDHEEMYRLGLVEGARREIAPAVGRQRVIEGLRIADAIRKGLLRSKPSEARHWPAKQRHSAFLDRFIADVLMAVADRPLPANDNCSTNAAASAAA